MEKYYFIEEEFPLMAKKQSFEQKILPSSYIEASGVLGMNEISMKYQNHALMTTCEAVYEAEEYGYFGTLIRKGAVAADTIQVEVTGASIVKSNLSIVGSELPLYERGKLKYGMAAQFDVDITLTGTTSNSCSMVNHVGVSGGMHSLKLNDSPVYAGGNVLLEEPLISNRIKVQNSHYISGCISEGINGRSTIGLNYATNGVLVDEAASLLVDTSASVSKVNPNLSMINTNLGDSNSVVFRGYDDRANMYFDASGDSLADSSQAVIRNAIALTVNNNANLVRVTNGVCQPSIRIEEMYLSDISSSPIGGHSYNLLKYSDESKLGANYFSDKGIRFVEEVQSKYTIHTEELPASLAEVNLYHTQDLYHSSYGKEMLSVLEEANIGKNPDHIGLTYTATSTRPIINVYFIFLGPVDGNNMHIGDEITINDSKYE